MPPLPTRPLLKALAVSLHITPSPASLAETRHLLSFLQGFGTITSFKVLRNPAHLPTFTRRAEILFQAPESAMNLRRAAEAGEGLETEGFAIKLLEGTWDHEAYIERARGWMRGETGGVWMVRGSGVGGKGGGVGEGRTGGFKGLKRLVEMRERNMRGRNQQV